MRKIAAFVLLLGLCGPSTGQDGFETQADLLRRASAEVRTADWEYQRVRMELVETLDDEARRSLEEADRAFAAYRDAESALRASRYRGGTLEPTEACAVWAALTRQRTRALRAHLNERF